MANIEEIEEIILDKDAQVAHFFIDKRTKEYVPFKDGDKIPEKDRRPIMGPKEGSDYKLYLEKILSILDILFVEHPAAHGFVTNRNVYTNVEIHKKSKSFVFIDLKNAFNQITQEQVTEIFLNLGLPKREASILGDLLTYKGFVQQGFATSPKLLNILAKRLDSRLYAYCRKHKVKYTRYADDLTFSSSRKIEQKVINMLLYIIDDCGFDINRKKFHVTSRRYVTITGILLDTARKLTMAKKTIRNLEKFFAFLERKNREKSSRGNSVKHVTKGLNAFDVLARGNASNKMFETMKKYKRISDSLKLFDYFITDPWCSQFCTLETVHVPRGVLNSYKVTRAVVNRINDSISLI